MPMSGSLSICCNRVTICGTPGRVSCESRRIEARSFSSAAASCATMFSIVVVTSAMDGIRAPCLTTQRGLERGDLFRRLFEHAVAIAWLQLQALQSFHESFVGLR